MIKEEEQGWNGRASRLRTHRERYTHQDNLLRAHAMLIDANGNRVSPALRRTGLTLKAVTHDFEIHASILDLTSESDADFLKFHYEGNFWYARVADVSFSYQKLECSEFGARYELRGTVTFEVVDYSTSAELLAECFVTELRFRDVRVTQGYRSLGGHSTAL